MKSLLRAAALSAALTVFALGAVPTANAEDANEIKVPHYGTWGFDLTGRDLSVKPGVDFFSYANGDWIKRTKIPDDKTEVGAFDSLYDLSDAITRKLIEDAAAGRSDDPDAAKIGAAFKAFMDEARAEQLDDKPLAGDLAAIRAEKTKADVVAVMGRAPYGFLSTIFGAGIQTDLKAPDRHAVYISVGGMGLPDRDYYLKPEFAEQKAKYQAYAAQLLKMIGWDDPEANAKAMVEFETKVAEAHWTRVETRDPIKVYHAMTPAELAAYAPGFDFQALLTGFKLPRLDRLVVTTDTAIPKVAKLFDTTPVETLKTWQAFHLANAAASYLSKRFVDAKFDFYGRVISGQPENEPRWKRAVGFVNGTLGESIGRMYVAKYFPPEAKVKIDALVKELIVALRKRIENVDWMSAETKAKALVKLSKLTVKIGYPSKWRDYGPLKMAPDDLYGNTERAIAYGWNYALERLNKPVDREEWSDTPQTVNAGYGPTNNEILFPAAILQPPFFDPTADLAVNYGGIGFVIGHELTHGFDDQGRLFDGTGALSEWWTPEDSAKFKSRADRLAAQFDKYESVKGYFVNGQLTLGENIADYGGVLIALDAYHAALGGKTPPVIDGLTGEQRFFLGFAQTQRTKVRDATAIARVKTDVHSPPRFRAIGPLRNIDAWYKAFDVGPDAPLYIAPDKRVRIW
jgi:putative endopeptidase